MKKTYHFLLSFGLLIFLSTVAYSDDGKVYPSTQEDTALADKMSSHQFIDDGQWINYRVHNPASVKDGERYPLVLFLHGWGERGTDNVAQIKKAVPEMLTYADTNNEPLYLIAPQFKELETWMNDVRIDLVDSFMSPKEVSLSIKLTLQLLQEFIESNPVDTDRIYVTGLSQGGFGTWDILVREPDLFAAAIPVAGGNAEDTAEKIKHIPLWVVHGSKDDVINPNFSRRSVAALEKARGNPIYTEYAEMTHADPDWHAVYSNSDILGWLFKQKKK